MGFWLFMTAMTLLVPGILIGVGAWMQKHPPKDINWVIGYRTARSMKTRETWDFANRYSGKLLLRAGWFTLAVSLAVMLLTMFRSEAVVSAVSLVLIFCQLIPLIGVIVMVERALKRKFDRDGNPREGTV